jgi:hypothetical protein
MKGQSFPHEAIFLIIKFPIHKKNNKSDKGKFEFLQFKSLQSSFVVFMTFLLIEFLKLIADTFLLAKSGGN